MVSYATFIYSNWPCMSPRAIAPNVRSIDARPRVLVADNHPTGFGNSRSLLATDFDIVGAVSDGRQALDLSLRLDPDIVVLDIRMPELDGFQTLRELRRIGSRAKVVLLTMHRERCICRRRDPAPVRKATF